MMMAFLLLLIKAMPMIFDLTHFAFTLRVIYALDMHYNWQHIDETKAENSTVYFYYYVDL